MLRCGRPAVHCFLPSPQAARRRPEPWTPQAAHLRCGIRSTLPLTVRAWFSVVRSSRGHVEPITRPRTICGKKHIPSARWTPKFVTVARVRRAGAPRDNGEATRHRSSVRTQSSMPFGVFIVQRLGFSPSQPRITGARSPLARGFGCSSSRPPARGRTLSTRFFGPESNQCIVRCAYGSTSRRSRALLAGSSLTRSLAPVPHSEFEDQIVWHADYQCMSYHPTMAEAKQPRLIFLPFGAHPKLLSTLRARLGSRRPALPRCRHFARL